MTAFPRKKVFLERDKANENIPSFLYNLSLKSLTRSVAFTLITTDLPESVLIVTGMPLESAMRDDGEEEGKGKFTRTPVFTGDCPLK